MLSIAELVRANCLVDSVALAVKTGLAVNSVKRWLNILAVQEYIAFTSSPATEAVAFLTTLGTDRLCTHFDRVAKCIDPRRS